MKEDREVLKTLQEIMKNIPRQNPDEDLPPESIDDFSLDPMDFAESAAMMLNIAEDIFYNARRANRKSNRFLLLCGLLEKLIRSLGSSCITKIVLEQKGYPCPELDQLSTQSLCGMVSFIMRKCNSAYREIRKNENDIDLELIGMQIRYFQLHGRLKATEEKIYAINTGKISVDAIVDRAKMLTKDSPNRSYSEQQVKPPVFRNPYAFPVDKEAIRDVEPWTRKQLPPPAPKKSPDWVKQAMNRTKQQPAANISSSRLTPSQETEENGEIAMEVSESIAQTWQSFSQSQLNGSAEPHPKPKNKSSVKRKKRKR